MNRNNALITPQILVWARERLDLSLLEAAEYLKKKPDVLKKWEEGSACPTMKQAKDMAKKYKIPYVFFFLPEPPQNIKLPKSQDYRTRSNQPLISHSIALKTLLFDSMQRREVMIELHHQIGVEPKKFTHYVDIQENDNIQIAEYVREILHVPDTIKKAGAFNFFRGVLENLGVLVFQAVDIPITEMRGLSVFEEIFPIIVVNRKDAQSARIFTLMHELVHLITHTAGMCDSTGFSELTSFDTELTCNHIAAQILVPENMFVSSADYMQLMRSWDDNLVRHIADSFFVSREVILGCLLTLKNISFDFYKQKMRQYTDEYSQSKQSTSGGPAPSADKGSELGKMYVGTVLTALNQDTITTRDAINYFDGLRFKHFEELERWCFA